MLFRILAALALFASVGPACTPHVPDYFGTVTSYQTLGAEWEIKHCDLIAGEKEAQVLKRCGRPIGELRVNNLPRAAAWCALYRNVMGVRPFAALCFRALEKVEGGDCMPGDRSPDCEAKPTGKYGGSTLTAVFRLTELPGPHSLTGLEQPEADTIPPPVPAAPGSTPAPIPPG